jgi:hypothetical protein
MDCRQKIPAEYQGIAQYVSSGNASSGAPWNGQTADKKITGSFEPVIIVIIAHCPFPHSSLHQLM